jgi:cobalamin biosynthesis Mg chelatase CobN
MKAKLTANDIAFIVILLLLGIITIALFGSCNTVKKAMHKKVAAVDSVAHSSSAASRVNKVDSNAKESIESEYKRVIVELPEGGSIVFDTSFKIPKHSDGLKEIQKSFPKRSVSFPAKTKITFEKGSSSELKEVEKKSVDSVTTNSEASAAVKKKDVAVDKQTEKSKIPVVGICFLAIAMLGVSLLIKTWLK